jgi:hypothetical protein
MLHALGVIALAVLFSGSAVRLCRIVVKFGGFVVIAICHIGSVGFSSQGAPTSRTQTRSWKSRDGVMGIVGVPQATAGRGCG